MSNRNPIFIEYYQHEKCDCYKVRNPFTAYAEHKLVLCRVDDGIDKARQLCSEVIASALAEALEEPVGV